MKKVMSGEAVILMITPVAPSMEVSSRAELIAISAATTALSLPVALPMPMWAKPASRMMADTSSVESTFTSTSGVPKAVPSSSWQ